MKLILVALAIASVTAQDCIPNAYPDANGKCQCNPGRSGHPDLCCYPSDYKGCWVAGDPVLTSYTGHKVGLDFPCGTMISSTKTTDTSPTVNVYAASKEMSTGSIFTSKVVVEIHQNFNKVLLTFHFDHFPVRIDYDKRNGFPPTSYYINEGMTQYLDDTGISKTISIERSNVIEFYTLKIGRVTITVRPPRGDDTNLPYSPGLCVAEPRASKSPSPALLYACSLNKDISNVPLGLYLDHAIRPMRNYLLYSPVLTETTAVQYATMCSTFKANLQQKCSSAHRFNALRKCAFILFQSLTRRCFHEADQGMRPIMAAFQRCVDAYCQGTKALCDGIKNDEKFQQCGWSLLKCHTWPKYREVNAFVAGEGDNNINLGTGDDNGGQEGGVDNWNPLENGILGENQDQDNNAGGVGEFNPADLF